jgi:hypothetical protein
MTKKAFVIITLVIAMLLSVGCSKSGAANIKDFTSKEWTGIVQVEGEDFKAVDAAALEYNKTGAQIEGVYYTDKRPEIAAVEKQVQDYMNMYLSTSYETYDPADFMLFYSSTKKAKYEKEGAAEDKAWFTENQIEFTPDGDVQFDLITADASFRAVRVDYKVNTKVNAKEGFEYKGSKTIRGTLWLTTESNVWRIVDEELNFL